MMEGVDYVSGEAAGAYQALLPEYKGLQGFRVLGKGEMPEGVEFGARYDSYTVDTETYTYHLLRQIRLLGGEVMRLRLNDVNEAFYIEGHDVKLVVNCSGLGFGDPKSFIIRGNLLRDALSGKPMLIERNRPDLSRLQPVRPDNNPTARRRNLVLCHPSRPRWRHHHRGYQAAQ